MPLKVKRHKKNKVPSHRNTKRLRRKHTKISNAKLDIINKSWNNRKSAKKNLSDMGLAYDANFSVTRAIKHPEKTASKNYRKTEIAKLLEKDAKALRVRKFKFPQAQAKYFTYLIKKYGDNYKEMAKDSKNVYQETWKKIRSRVTQYKKLEQYQKFMYGRE